MTRTPRPSFTIPLPDGRTLELGARTLVMGILNVTPDSFAGGGERFNTSTPDAAVAAALRMAEQGADLIDIGGESTRPGAAPVPADDELRRIVPVLEGLRGRIAIPLSIDTYKAVVAERALDLGATIVNDVSALANDSGLAAVVARRRAAVILMHSRGRSADMYARAEYRDVVAEVIAELASRVAVAEAAGISRERIVIDPGFGFGKRAADSMTLLRGLTTLASIGLPILSGVSRKSFLKAALGDVPPAGRVWGTAAAVTASVLAGAHIVRVHDVAEMAQVVRVADSLRAI
jgi:dihydropteroate synthase